MNGLPPEYGTIDPITGQIIGQGRFHNMGTGQQAPMDTTAQLPAIPYAQMPQGTPGTVPQQPAGGGGGGGDSDLALALIRAQQRAAQGLYPGRGFVPGGGPRNMELAMMHDDFTPFPASDYQYLRRLWKNSMQGGGR